MPALKKDEIWNPRYGVGDVEGSISGLADFSKCYHNNFYIDADLTLTDGEFEFAQFTFTTSLDRLAEEGYSEADGKEIAAAVSVLCKHINAKITVSNPEYERTEKWTGGPLLSEKDGIVTIHPVK